LKVGSYNEQGAEIIKFANENNIPIIFDLENGFSSSDFRDKIHINDRGQKKIANLIEKNIIINKKMLPYIYNK
jgi:hypothetical protein